MLYIVTFKTLPGTGILEECLISLKNPLQIQILWIYMKMSLSYDKDFLDYFFYDTRPTTVKCTN